MSDSQFQTAETDDFGSFTKAAYEGSSEAVRNTSQDDSASQPPSAGEQSGTAHQAPHLDRPLPGGQPLTVRFQSEE
jgi:hypothetical protein